MTPLPSPPQTSHQVAEDKGAPTIGGAASPSYGNPLGRMSLTMAPAKVWGGGIHTSPSYENPLGRMSLTMALAKV